MKIIEVIERADSLYPNSYTTGEKIAWLNELGAMLKCEYLKSYDEAGQIEEFAPISDIVSQNTLINAPYDEMYVDFLLAKCCYYQRDFEGYNRHILAFNSKLEDFSSWYISENMPKRKSKNAIKGWWH